MIFGRTGLESWFDQHSKRNSRLIFVIMFAPRQGNLSPPKAPTGVFQTVSEQLIEILGDTLYFICDTYSNGLTFSGDGDCN